MSDPTLVPFIFDSADNEHPLGHHFDKSIQDELANLSDDGTIPDEDIYDAINDETFGVETSMISENDNDLAEFSIRTASLALLDDLPTTSIKPPDPSQIPIPKMGSDHCLHFVSSTSESKSGIDFKVDTNKDFSYRSDQTNTSNTNNDLSPSIWASGTFNGINSLLDIYKGQQTPSHPMYETFNTMQHLQKEQRSHSPSMNVWPQFTQKNAFSTILGSDLERALLKEAISNSDDVVAQGECSSPTPISANDLERKLLQESMVLALLEKDKNQQELSLQCQQKQKELLTRLVSSPISQVSQRTSSLTSQHFNNILPQLLPQHYPQNCQQIQQPLPLPSPSLPPPFMLTPGMSPLQHPMFNPIALLQHHPPHPDLMKTMALHAAASTAAALQSGRQSIVSTPLLATPTTLQHHSIQNLNHLQHIQQQLSSNLHDKHGMLAMVPASLHPRIEKQQNKKSNLGLPSGKTIADFAMDPYAGLLSTKEREWLIKIHLIQCLGTGDPMNDDYYYTVWKQRNILKKAPETWQKDARPPRYYSFDATFPSKDYTAPSFAGALGKPTHSSSCQPRQILSVHNDNCDDDINVDLVGNIKQTAATRQKRLRLMLMKIEKAALALIDCRDIRRKLRFFEETAITEYIDKSEIVDRVTRFTENMAFIDARIFPSDQLPTVMLIQKGRQLVYDWLQFLCSKDERTQQGINDKFINYISTVLETMNKWARKISDDETIHSFATDFCSLFSQITSRDELFSLLRFSNFDQNIIKDSKIIQIMLLSLLTALIQNSNFINSPLSLQHLGEFNGIYFFLFQMPVENCVVLPEKIMNNIYFSGVINWNFIKQWLNEQNKFTKGEGFIDCSLAQKISQAYY